MHHQIHFATDNQMPEGQDFLLAVEEDRVLIFYRASAVRPAVDPERAARVLEDSWAAYRALERELLGV